MAKILTTRINKMTEENKSPLDDVFNTVTPEDYKEEIADKMAGTGIDYFSLAKDQSALVRFLDDRPLTFYQHRVWDKSSKNGKGGWRMLTCMRTNCPLCIAGDKPRYVGAYRLVHIDNKEKDGSGREVLKPKYKVFIKGVNTLEILERKNKKKPLSSENIEVERAGEGFDTKYIFDFSGDITPPVYEQPEASKMNLKELFKVQLDTVNRMAAEKAPVSAQPSPQPAVKETVTTEEDGIPF